MCNGIIIFLHHMSPLIFTLHVAADAGQKLRHDKWKRAQAARAVVHKHVVAKHGQKVERTEAKYARRIQADQELKATRMWLSLLVCLYVCIILCSVPTCTQYLMQCQVLANSMSSFHHLRKPTRDISDMDLTCTMLKAKVITSRMRKRIAAHTQEKNAVLIIEIAVAKWFLRRKEHARIVIADFLIHISQKSLYVPMQRFHARVKKLQQWWRLRQMHVLTARRAFLENMWEHVVLHRAEDLSGVLKINSNKHLERTKTEKPKTGSST